MDGNFIAFNEPRESWQKLMTFDILFCCYYYKLKGLLNFILLQNMQEDI